MANYEIERALRAQSAAPLRIAGVDEVGRGPWAGPVTAAAVILDPDNIPEGLNDSKKLSAKRREALFGPIMDTAWVSVVHVEVSEIDQINILQATFRAMERAVAGLDSPDHILVDGNKIPPNLPCAASAHIKGDAKSVSVAAASIIAKVTRDRLMLDLSKSYPGYGWETNAGYGTKIHQLGLRNLGVTPHHRRSFKPIHNILYSVKNAK
ncbi:ribonuclease HII [Amylibacter marinus]|uniref:Ribonuclease HII n=1 Tax=Amylibacter marinus TaxID=1475483 RepID=A0ABQ5VWS4_9RHOB|nr:ribonuclease HII [Amylibacter marinus]GLQ35654.1 ribonuclease HII [Amylibacter marinus]